MKNWREASIQPNASLREAIAHIDAASVQVALVVDEAGRLLGTVTDGDVRRALLRGVTLESPVHAAMNTQPTRVHVSQDRNTVLALMHARGIHQVPLVDDANRVVGLEILDELIKTPTYDNPVVLMAGGLGKRLRPLTEDCPKPMLRVGERPILEIVLESFVNYGFRRFYFAVNYLAEMIERHFGDGSRWGVQIEYLREQERLGTAGALSLLPQRPDRPFFVMNGDVLTNVNFRHLLDYHTSHNAYATMCVRSYEQEIPYGVVTVDGHRLVSVTEKPKQQFLVSAGIYVLEPQVLEGIKPGTFLDMPTLFEQLAGGAHSTAVFPLREYWLDIGRLEDYERASGDLKRGLS
ncbi:MAG: nucleotidyltransferase family protein [Pseudomonadota bacterium]